MTTSISIVFPHQIFEENPCLDKHRRVFIVEDDLFFSYQPFHKMKLVLHRAAMKFYADYLSNKGYRVTYIDHDDYNDLATFFKRDLSDESVEELHVCNPVDFYLSKRLKKQSEMFNIKCVVHETPNFYNTAALNNTHLGAKKKTYRMGDFYKKQRIYHNIMVDQNDEPLGGAWSFDKENRKSLPKGYTAPFPNFPKNNQYVERAIEYVETHFGDHPGATQPFIYPATFDEAKQFLKDFLEYRFQDFGPYQDALSNDQPFLNHSLLSSSINCGLLSPKYVVDQAVEYANENKVPLSSLEGFVRQIIGWREFMRAIYERHSVEQRNKNFWKSEKKLDGAVLDEIKLLKDVHRKAEKSAYAHHIERLMVLGNFFLLAEIHPDAVYNYFMTFYIDAYDWVMVPNVYGMSQFSDGGILATKPYISSSNYLKKMGAKSDPDWMQLWDALYWRFLFKNRDFFENNHRTKMMVYHLDKMSEDRLENLLKRANDFLNRIDEFEQK